MTLALTVLPSDRPARGAFLFLHGILGSGANWRGLAKRILADLPDVEGWLVDLRMHGRSQDVSPPHTLAACADDLAALVQERGTKPTHVLGHSFGGKVALAYGEAYPEGLERVFVVDSHPGIPSIQRGSETTVQVMELLHAAPPSYPSRAAFAEHFSAGGLAPGVVAWLAMNLVAKDGGFVFRLDLGAIDAMLADYLARDLFSFVEAPPRAYRGRTVFVKGALSPTIDAEAEARIVRASERAHGEGGSQVALERIEGAGHWVHVDAPDALLAAVSRHLR